MIRKTFTMLVAALAVAVLGGATVASAGTGYQLDSVSNSNPNPGDTISLYANGYGPSTEATATLFSTPVALGTYTSRTDGVVVADVIIPADTSIGQHRIDVVGVDRDGAAKTTSFTIQVGTQAGGSNPTGGLPNTGLRIGLSIAIAVLALSIGGTLLTTARRRDSAA